VAEREREDGALEYSPFLAIHVDEEAECLRKMMELADLLPSEHLKDMQEDCGLNSAMFQVETIIGIFINMLCPIAEIMQHTRAALTPKQSRAIVELVGSTYCAVSICQPAVVQALFIGRVTDNKKLRKMAENTARMLANTHTGLRIFLDILKEAELWPFDETVPISEDNAKIIASSMGFADHHILKATLEEASEIKDKFKDDPAKGIAEFWTVTKAAGRMKRSGTD